MARGPEPGWERPRAQPNTRAHTHAHTGHTLKWKEGAKSHPKRHEWPTTCKLRQTMRWPFTDREALVQGSGVKAAQPVCNSQD